MQTTKLSQNLTDLSRQGMAIEFFSAYQEMDIDRMLNLCTDNGTVFFTPLGEAGKGKIKELGKNLWLMLMECFPDLDNTVIFTKADSTGNVTCNVKIYGTQAKDFAGIPTKGLRFDSDHIFIFHFNEDNLIDAIRITWDHVSFSRQLGS
jgi:ketosteroid isomerase-like protein